MEFDEPYSLSPREGEVPPRAVLSCCRKHEVLRQHENCGYAFNAFKDLWLDDSDPEEKTEF